MLPIHAVLDPLKSVLANGNTAILAAPPGAGKTTVVPLALLDQAWLGDGRVLVLEPRRIAARAAADRMAATLGQEAGGTVGYRTRLQSRIGPKTRIEVITEGVFTRMILDDPGLEGVGAVLFDEFHERSLDADLGLALARETQGALREDLRLLVMSATLDVAGVSRLLEGAPVIEAEGRAYPVETRYLGRNPTERFEEAMARACLTALGEETGSVLAFLPGQGEIHRVARLISERLRLPNVDWKNARLNGSNVVGVVVCASRQIWPVLGVSCCGLLPVWVWPALVVSVHASGVAVSVASTVPACFPASLAAAVSALDTSLAGSVNLSGVVVICSPVVCLTAA